MFLFCVIHVKRADVSPTVGIPPTFHMTVS